MTVAELIARLQNYPADLEVVVASYEQGYDPATDLREIAIEKVEDREWYVGVYDDAPAPACAQRAGKSGRKALLIHSRFLRSEEKA
ncbi:MAG TPA: hypothetical protein ENN34_08575 [Deltaproteobacteria bacterium]|nr:hypothetical protein [Deltaproteobacteria bacterium]